MPILWFKHNISNLSRQPDGEEPGEKLLEPSSLPLMKVNKSVRRRPYKKVFQRTGSDRSSKLKGWRIGLWTGFSTACVILLGNVTLIVLGASRNGGYVDGIGILEIGPTDKISSIGTAYHILINILSTALLTSSNFCMQILGSPTRQEVDVAH